MQGLTHRQSEVLRFLREAPMTPTYREMADALGIQNISGIQRTVLALERRGFIERIPRHARSIRVLDKPKPLPL